MEIAQNLILEVHRRDPGQPRVDRQMRKLNDGLAALEQIYGARDMRHDTAIGLGDIAVATTLLLFEHAVVAGYSSDIEALRWRRKYPHLTTFAATVC